jgi:hypothetical protein
MDPPTKGTYRDVRGQLLDNVRDGATPANMDYSVRDIYSKKHLDFSLGVAYDNAVSSLDSKFDFSRTTETNKLLVTFTQLYYSIGVTLPNPLAPGIVTDPGTYLRPNDVIVASVTFGRVLLFTAESHYARERLRSAVDYAMDSLAGSADVEFDAARDAVLRDTRIHATVMGGSAASGATLISDFGDRNLSGIHDWIQRGATYDPAESPGVPVSYHAKYADSLDTANVYLSTEYTARNCRPKTQRYRVHNVHVDVKNANDEAGGKRKEELYGEIRLGGWQFRTDQPGDEAIQPRGQDGFSVWDRGPKQWIRVAEAEPPKKLDVDEVIVFDAGPDLDRQKSYIAIDIAPRERDTGPDDFQDASQYERWHLTQSPSDPDALDSTGSFTMNFASGGTELEFSYDITPLPPRGSN